MCEGEGRGGEKSPNWALVNITLLYSRLSTYSSFVPTTSFDTLHSAASASSS